MQLQEKYPDDVLAVTLSVDFDGEDGKPSDELKTNVQSLLEELRINCVNIVCSDNVDQTLEALDVFSIPAVLIYDAAGKQGCRAVLCVEMSMGQMVEDVERSVAGQLPVHWYGKCGGEVPTPEEVMEEIRKLVK